MNINEIKELLKLVNEYNIAELELEMDETKLRLVKNNSSLAAAPSDPAPVNPPSQEGSPAPQATAEGVSEICSPMVGTFYRASSPGSEPFVTIGMEIEPGQVLCILEAMKLMNELEADVSGKLVDILVEDGQPVEYGQPLFLVELVG